MNGSRAYMAHFQKRKNAKVNVKEVTVIEKEGQYYHIEISGDIFIGEINKPIEENGKIYIYSLNKEEVLLKAFEYKRELTSCSI
ncbi:hypothetical protein ACQKEY_22500 [Lysinibacillus fusiformis]|uniref:hypothetical protein n=1 Tax=Lysinibacillus fusiformis TaxID=28031 RepID=UPI003CFE90CA